jgi:glycosyltransferase involved in cell wall biosynthesis
MKIVIAVHHFPPKYNGGAELNAYRTAVALQARGHEVRVICVEKIDAPLQDEITWVDDEYNEIRVRRLSFNLAAAPDRTRWEYDNPWIGEHLQKYLHQEKPEIFHLVSGYLMTGSALGAAQQLGIPTVVTLTDFWFLCPRISLLQSNGHLSTLPINPVTCARCLGEEKRRYRLPGSYIPGLMEIYWKLQKEKIERIESRQDSLLEKLNQTNVIISPSRFLRTAYIEAGIDANRILYSRQGIDFPTLTDETIVKVPSTQLRVGYMGQIAELKGVHLLFEAARYLPDAPMTVWAYGNPKPFPKYAARLEELIGEDPRLGLAGLYRPQELSQVLRNLDVIVVPSQWYENSPNVILEAFAHHTPVIASKLGGMAEMVHHDQNGLLFEPGNAADLAHQLKRLMDEPKLLQRLSKGTEFEVVRSVADEINELEGIYSHISAAQFQYNEFALYDR